MWIRIKILHQSPFYIKIFLYSPGKSFLNITKQRKSFQPFFNIQTKLSCIIFCNIIACIGVADNTKAGIVTQHTAPHPHSLSYREGRYFINLSTISKPLSFETCCAVV